jgi:hypothetical protein
MYWQVERMNNRTGEVEIVDKRLKNTQANAIRTTLELRYRNKGYTFTVREDHSNAVSR